MHWLFTKEALSKRYGYGLLMNLGHLERLNTIAINLLFWRVW